MSLLFIGKVIADVECGGNQDTVLIAEDSAESWLHHHPGKGPPILVVHGISSNHWSWDLNDERSIAPTLQAFDMDVWFLDLRGHGCAERLRSGHRQQPSRNFDDYGQQDVSAAITHIRRETGHKRVAYIGHSMGGHVALSYVAEHGDTLLSALVIVASPIDFNDLEPYYRWAWAGAFIGSPFPILPSPMAGRLAARFQRLPFRLDSMLYAEGSLSAPIRRTMYRRIVSPVSRGENQHYRRILNTGHLVSSDGELDYRDTLSTLTTPLLIIAGDGDMVAPPSRVHPYYDLAGSSDKTWISAGIENGFSHDYGHLDLVLGDQAPAEIHDRIGQWLHTKIHP